VKRTVGLIIGALTLGLAIYVTGRSSAQPGGGMAASEPRTRIALINLAQVIKHYQKVIAFQNEVKGLLQPYQDKAKGIQAQIEAHTKKLQDPALKAEEREVTEKNLRAWQRSLEDLNNDAKAFWTKKNDDQMVILYKEVMDAAQRYAGAHNFELVMHYNDATPDMPEYWHPGNVARKIQAGACIPMYVTPGMEITKPVVDALNAHYTPTASNNTAQPHH
jgi:Skp family chaperone for outer membrane proteins